MNKQELTNQIKQKKSFLCIGLDSDINKIPAFLSTFSDPVYEFNKQIIDATNDLCIAYKLNTAFYECNGTKGWETLKRTITYIKTNYPKLLVIADAKRGDIGNTSQMYAKTFFENLNADAVTVAPYMGVDSASPFLKYQNKWTILLALTSNEGASDFQLQNTNNNTPLYQEVIKKAIKWNTADNLMFVVGATKAKTLKEIRKIVPEHFLLIPGVGAQGGNLNDVAKFGMTYSCGLIVNSSRAIIFTNNNTQNFSYASREKAMEVQKQMELLLKEKNM